MAAGSRLELLIPCLPTITRARRVPRKNYFWKRGLIRYETWRRGTRLTDLAQPDPESGTRVVVVLFLHDTHGLETWAAPLTQLSGLGLRFLARVVPDQHRER